MPGITKRSARQLSRPLLRHDGQSFQVAPQVLASEGTHKEGSHDDRRLNGGILAPVSSTWLLAGGPGALKGFTAQLRSC